MSVADLSIDELNQIIDLAVEKKINNYFEEHFIDGDLTNSVSSRLASQLNEVKNGERGRSLESIINELGLQ